MQLGASQEKRKLLRCDGKRMALVHPNDLERGVLKAKLSLDRNGAWACKIFARS